MGNKASKSPPNRHHHNRAKSMPIIKHHKIKPRSKISKATNVLIVGSCFSGKSVIANQISYLYNPEFSMNHMRDKISNEMCKIMLKCIHKIYPHYESKNKWDDVDIELDDNLESISDKLDTLPLMDQNIWTIIIQQKQFYWSYSEGIWEAIYYIYKMNETIKNKIDNIENDNILRNSCIWFDKRHNYKYACNKIKEWMNPEYQPCIDDILCLTRRTVGTPVISVTIHGQKYAFKELGGHRDERKRWKMYSQFPTFGNSLKYNTMDCVLYTVSLCGYHEPCFEDALKTNRKGKNKMIDSIELFHEICDNEELKEATVFVILTFMDQFKELLMEYALTESECDIFKNFKVSDGFIEKGSVMMEYFVNKGYGKDVDISLPKDTCYLIGEYVNIGRFCIDEYYEECLSFIKTYFAKLSTEKNQSVSIYAVNTLNTKEVQNIVQRIESKTSILRMASY